MEFRRHQRVRVKRDAKRRMLRRVCGKEGQIISTSESGDYPYKVAFGGCVFRLCKESELEAFRGRGC